MLDKDLVKHAGEFRRYLRNRQYEVSDVGIVFPRAGVAVVGEYRHSVNGADERVDCNLVPFEGLNYFLTAGLLAGAVKTAWFVSLYAANYTPVPTLTAASYPATTSEIVSASEGYTEGSRQPWVGVPPVEGMTDSYASRAEFTIITASSLSVNGAGVLSEAAKGATNGVLLSAAKFSAVRTLNDDDLFQLGYRITLTGI